jgi:hypothetical protein
MSFDLPQIVETKKNAVVCHTKGKWKNSISQTALPDRISSILEAQEYIDKVYGAMLVVKFY